MNKLLILVSTLILSLAAVAADVQLPDPKSGQIDGKVAVMFWPASDTGGKSDALLPADDCHVVLAPWANPSAEKTYPCGKWFQPADGRYRAWLEKGGAITPTTGVLNFAAQPFQGSGQGVIMPVRAGGRVALASDVALSANAELILANLDSCCEMPMLGVPFTRRANASATGLRSGLPMPSGRVFAAIFDRTTRDAIALARLAFVESGKVATVAPRPPAGGTTDVFVSLTRPRARKARNVDVIALTLGGNKPDMLFDGADRIYAAWYGVNGATASLAGSSKTLHFATRTVKLTPGRVVTVREELK